jgi:sacsin
MVFLNYLGRPEGHIFCFLPLPLEVESPTGLRHHVHGYFAIDDNRRHIKKRSAEQAGQKLTDKHILWNEYLINTLLPRCLTALIGKVPDAPYITHQQKRDAIYSLIPQLDTVKQPWKPLADAFLVVLPELAVFYSPVTGGKFLPVRKATFDMEEDATQLTLVIRRILLHNNVELVSAPQFVVNQLGSLAKTYTAVTVCSAFKNVDRPLSISDNESTILLKYLLTNLGKRISNIIGCKLLPLQDGTWVEFEDSSSSTDRVYVDSSEHKKSLIPGMKSWFLDSNFVEDCRLLTQTGRLRHVSKLAATAGSKIKFRHWVTLSFAKTQV